MNFYNQNDKLLANYLNLDTNFDVVRKEIGINKKAIVYFLSSLSDSESVFQLAYSFINAFSVLPLVTRSVLVSVQYPLEFLITISD